VTSNAYGVVSIVVGKGQVLSGSSFDKIDWSKGGISMKTEFDPDGGETYTEIGTTQLQSVPMAEYAKTTSAVENPKNIKIQATNETGEEDALFEVKDKDGNVVFAVYNDGVRVYVDDTDPNGGGKAAKSGFAVAGRSGKAGEGNTYFAVNDQGTQVYVDDDPTDPGKAAKAKFAVAGKSGKGDDNYLVINKAGTQIYVDDEDSKAAKAKFAVAGKSGKADDNLLVVNQSGTKVYVDDDPTDPGKAAKAKFAVAGKSGKTDDNYLIINKAGTQIFVDDEDSKAAKAKFAVAGKSGKADDNLLVVNQSGTKVFVDDDPTDPGKAAKAKFAVAGKSGKDDDNYLVVNKAGTQVFVDEADGKAAKAKFAVAGKSGKSDGSIGDNYLVINDEGTKVFVDGVNGQKAAKAKFAVASVRNGKSETAEDFFLINKDGTQVFIDEDTHNNKAAKAKFAVASVKSGKDGDDKASVNPNYLVIDSDSTRVYIDNTDNGKAAKSGFAVAGRSAHKSGNADILKVTGDSTRVYVTSSSSKSGFGVEGKSGAGSKSGFAVTEKGANGNAGYMNVTGANFFAGYNAGKNTNVHYDQGGEVPAGIFNIETDPGILDWSNGTNFLLGANNTYIGNNAGYSNDNGMNNVFVGVNAGYSLSGTFSFNNVFLGTSAGKNLKNMTGTVAIGNSAGRGLESFQPGEYDWVHGDVFIGDQAGFSITTGTSNVFVGAYAGKNNTTGSDNVYIGSAAGSDNTTSSGNTMINSLGGHVSGDDNVIIGGTRGQLITYGSNNIIIGLTSPLWPSYYTDGASNRLAIGTWITGNSSQVKMEKNLFVNGNTTLNGHLKSNTNGINDIGSSDWRFNTIYANSLDLKRADGKYTGNVEGSLVPQSEDQNLGGVSPYNSNYVYRWNAIYAKTLDLSDGATIANKLAVSSDGTEIEGKLKVSGTSGAEINGGVYPWTGTGSYSPNLGKKDNRWNYVYANYFNGAQSVTAPYVYAKKQISVTGGGDDMNTDLVDITGTTPAQNSNYYGGSYMMKGDATGSVYGIYCNAMAKGTNYGIYAAASGGTTNWAGYFNGDVKVTGNFNLGGSVTSSLKPSSTNYDLGSSGSRWGTVYANSLNISSDFYLYPIDVTNSKSTSSTVAAVHGKSTAGTASCYGLYGEARSTNSNAHNHGITGEASGGAIAIGVYGYAEGGASRYAAWFGGDVMSTTGVYANSDSRLKKNVETIDGALDKVLKLRGVTYYWKNREEMAAAKGVSADSMRYGYDDKKHIGVIAQEMEEVFPELVGTDPDGFKSVSYSNLTPILIEAVKELKAEKDELQTTVTTQQTKIDNQQQQIDELKRLVEELLKKQ
ncbi:MAG: tail fiber domain-containing protein, partial [Salinivirgaceae bacterium]|nr:tail fiber domain-containing protein [Salinivirgaceae bacterium]